MAEQWFETLKQNIEAFINNATEEEMDEAFNLANHEYYRHVKTPVVFNATYYQIPPSGMRTATSSWGNHRSRSSTADTVCKADNYLYAYYYLLAA